MRPHARDLTFPGREALATSALSDLDLLDGLRRRDEKAFGVLVEAYSPVIRRWSARMAPDTAEVEDVLQDVLVAAWWYSPSLRDDTVLIAWLRTITENACRKRARTRARRPAVPAGLVPTDEPTSEPADVAQAVDVEAALRQLSTREAGILRLLYAEDVPLAEAARRMNVSSDAAKSLAARARRRFKTRFDGWFRAMAGFGLPAELLRVPQGAGEAVRAPATAAAAAALAVVLASTGGPAPETSRSRAARVEAASAGTGHQPTSAGAPPNRNGRLSTSQTQMRAWSVAGARSPWREPGAEDQDSRAGRRQRAGRDGKNDPQVEASSQSPPGGSAEDSGKREDDGGGGAEHPQGYERPSRGDERGPHGVGAPPGGRQPSPRGGTGTEGRGSRRGGQPGQGGAPGGRPQRADDDGGYGRGHGSIPSGGSERGSPSGRPGGGSGSPSGSDGGARGGGGNAGGGGGSQSGGGHGGGGGGQGGGASGGGGGASGGGGHGAGHGGGGGR